MPAKRAENRLTTAAVEDLDEIWRFTFERWGSEQAHRYIDAMVEAFVRLSRAPQRADACDHIRKGYRRGRVGRHAIYFRVTEYGIFVVRVLHGRMDASRHL